MEFLSICLLLAHPGPSHMLFDPVNRRPLPSEQNVFHREPCHHAHQEILSYLDATCPAFLHNSGRTYLACILSANGIDFQQAYRGSLPTSSSVLLSTWKAGLWVLMPALRQAQPQTQFLPSIFLTFCHVSLVSLIARISF
jgi:hypothetical protein